MSPTFFVDQEIVEIEQKKLEQLRIAASQSITKRARFCLHRSYEDSIQDMVIAFCKDSYVHPHRNVRKSKLFHVIEGKLMLVFFDDGGAVVKKIEMGMYESEKPFLCRLNVNAWHTVVPLSDYLIILETNGGPFVKGEDEYAKWAPGSENEKGIKKFMERLSAELAK